MILPRFLAAALLVAAGFDSIDRAHGAIPSTSVRKETEQSDPGFWQRVKSRLFSQKSPDKTAQSTSRSGQNVSTAHSSAKTEGEEKIVRSNISLRQLLASRLNRKQDSKNPVSKKPDHAALAHNDRRPILDRLRSKLSWNRERPVENASEPNFAAYAQPKLESNVDSDSTLADLQPAPTPVVFDPSTSASDSSIRKNYPVGERNLLTRVDSNPRWTPPPSLVPAPQSDVSDKTTGTSTALDQETKAPGLTDSKELEQAGPALIDPNATLSTVEPIPAASSAVVVQAISDPAKSPDSVGYAVQPEAAATHESPAPVEPANLEVEDQTAPAQIAQTGFVHHSTPIVTSDDSSPRQNRSGAAASGSGSSHPSLLSGILAPALCERFDHLPIECYPIVGLLLLSMLVLLLSRGRPTTAHTAQPSLANVATHPAGTFSWPTSMVIPSALYARGIGQTAQPRGGFFGPLTTTIGLAIVAVGATAVLRAEVAQQPALMRPGVMVAAIGQFVLLLGIVALIVSSRHLRNARKSAAFGLAPADSVAAQPIVAGPVPYMALAPNFGWPTATAACGSPSNQSGQIAQLKAQLACLSQQLDHLGTGDTSGPAKSV